MIGPTYVSPDVTLHTTSNHRKLYDSCVGHSRQHCSLPNKSVDMSTSFAIPDFTLFGFLKDEQTTRYDKIMLYFS